MLISYEDIIKKYNLNIKTILHVGAHIAEEKEAYFSNGCEKVIWVEGNPELCQSLLQSLDIKNNIVLQAVVSDYDDQEVDFMITNNKQSSSILNLGLHKNLFPDIVMQSMSTVKTKTLKTLFLENNLNFKEIDFLNLDIQGAELLALQGIGEELTNLKAIFTEINTDYVYQECALITEIDQYLSNFGFERVETVMWSDHPWGDALYLKKEI